jgi:alginate O-acetyltransferase complex protein AlgI
MVTMLLGGLWHGAAWTFVAWGALHGLYLCLNHVWNYFAPKSPSRFAPFGAVVAWPLTFLSVVVAWVFFRADSIASALVILARMVDPSHIVLGRSEIGNITLILICAALAWLAPNTQRIMAYDHEKRSVGSICLIGRLRSVFLCAMAAIFALGVLGIQQHSEFIYFRF